LIRNANVLALRICALQPLLALYFLATEYHLRTVAVPIDSGNFDVVSARDHGRVLRITQDGVNGLASRVGDCSVENVGSTAGEGKLD